MALAVTDLVWIDSTGYNYLDFPSFLQFFTEQYKGIYGDDVYLGPDSEDGQWVAVQAQAAYDTAALAAMTYASFSPVTAQGTGLARVVKINGLEKLVASNSTVDLVIVGTAGTPIADGIAIDSLQQKWLLPASVLIPGPGTITVTATAELPGAINALPNTITSIFTPTLGWQTVNNPSAATAGSPVESDGTLRARQIVSTSLPALTVLEATIGAVENVPGVTQVKGYENDTGATDSNGIPAHTISLVVEGGTDVAAATAMRVKKTPGTRTFGTTSVALVDSKGMPITINFFRPDDAVIGARITIAELDGYSTDYAALIQTAVANAIKAVPIGGLVVLTKLFLVAYLPGTVAAGTFDVVSIELQENGGGFGTSNIQLLFKEIPRCVAGTDVVIVP